MGISRSLAQTPNYMHLVCTSIGGVCKRTYALARSDANGWCGKRRAHAMLVSGVSVRSTGRPACKSTVVKRRNPERALWYSFGELGTLLLISSIIHVN